MLMFTRTHARLAASDAKKIGEQAKLIEKLTTERDEVKATSEKVFRANLKLAADLQEAKRRLSIFTAPRKRNSRGWFVSGKQEQAA
jgi:hypothetical protein